MFNSALPLRHTGKDRVVVVVVVEVSAMFCKHERNGIMPATGFDPVTSPL